MKRLLILPLLTVFSCACASTPPKPVLYPDAHFRGQSKERIEKDIEFCTLQAEKYVEWRKKRGKKIGKRTLKGAGFGAFLGVVTGLVTGNIRGAVASGAAIGAAAGLAKGAYDSRKPGSLWRRFVEYCLAERGYKPAGWNDES